MNPALKAVLESATVKALENFTVSEAGKVKESFDTATGSAQGPTPVGPVRRAQAAVGTITAALGLPLQLMNGGFALATDKLAALVPAMPAAANGDPYFAPPHAHAHPPSLVPPGPAVPLPSIGVVVMGTSLKVLIGGRPAARIGDVGIAPTCGGFAPLFEITRGSSKVFIGGKRAARLTDLAIACTPAPPEGPKVFAAVSTALGYLGGALSVAADAVDASGGLGAPDAGARAQGKAQALAAAMGAAQLAADVATAAAKNALGKDPGVGGGPGIVAFGNPRVRIGGFPMPEFPDPVSAFFNMIEEKLTGPKPAAASGASSEDGAEGAKACPI